MKTNQERKAKDMADTYELDDEDRALIPSVRKAIEYENDGCPAKDVIDECDIVEAMRLLLNIIDAGYAS